MLCQHQDNIKRTPVWASFTNKSYDVTINQGRHYETLPKSQTRSQACLLVDPEYKLSMLEFEYVFEHSFITLA